MKKVILTSTPWSVDHMLGQWIAFAYHRPKAEMLNAHTFSFGLQKHHARPEYGAWFSKDTTRGFYAALIICSHEESAIISINIRTSKYTGRTITLVPAIRLRWDWFGFGR